MLNLLGFQENLKLKEHHNKPVPRFALCVVQYDVVSVLRIIAHLICRPDTNGVNLEAGFPVSGTRHFHKVLR